MHPDEERFAEKIQITEECWIWTGALGGRSRDYAYFYVDGRMVRAHRWHTNS